MDKDPFKEYIKQTEPNKRDKGYAWHTAIELQAVDGLKTSNYLIDTAIKNIEGVLDGATVLYGSASELRVTLEYDLSEEKKFSYKNLSMDEIMLHNRAMHISEQFIQSANPDASRVLFVVKMASVMVDGRY